MATIAEIEKRRAARRESNEAAKDKQLTADLEAIDAIEAESGESLNTMTANGFKPGACVKLAFRAPTSPQYKRYLDQVGQAQQKQNAAERRKAQETFAEACLVYPPAGDVRAATLDALPGVLISIAIEAAKAAELRTEDEGKG